MQEERTFLRKSNIELLRIVSMYLIVMHHFSVHGPWPASGSFSSDVVIMLFSFGGKLGVDVFVLISGYFMIKSRFKIRSVLRVFLETWFYSILIFLLFAIFQTSMISDIDLRKVVIPVSSGEYWFVTTYIALILLSPFLNALYDKLAFTEQRKLIIIGFAVFSIVPTITTFNPLASNLIWFVYLYILGGWLRDYSQFNHSIKTHFLDPASIISLGKKRMIFICTVIVLGSIVIIEYARRHFGFDLLSSEYFIQQNTVFILLAATALLAWFAELDVPSSSIINHIAQTTFGIYLIHDNPLVRHWLWPMWEPLYDHGWLIILIVGFISTVAVFMACSLIDFVRIRLIEAPFFRWLDKRFGSKLSCVDNWFNGWINNR